MMGKMASMFGMGGGDPLAGLDLSALTPEQLETIKRELGGQLPPGFPGASASGAAAPAGTAPSPILPASFPGGLAGAGPRGFPVSAAPSCRASAAAFRGFPAASTRSRGKKK